MTNQAPDLQAIRDAVTLLTGRLRPNVDPLFALRLDAVKERLDDWNHEPAVSSDEETVRAGCTCGWVAGCVEDDTDLGRQLVDLRFQAHANEEAGRQWL